MRSQVRVAGGEAGMDSGGAKSTGNPPSLQLRQPRGLVVGDQRFDDFVEFAGHDAVDFVEGELMRWSVTRFCGKL